MAGSDESILKGYGSVHSGVMLLVVVSGNTYSQNLYLSGNLGDHVLGSDEVHQTTIDGAWFSRFP